MDTVTTRPWDAARYLHNEEDIALYLDECLQDDDPRMLAVALGTVARARNMSQLARDVGMSREGLYKALSDEGNPTFATVTKVANALGLRLRFEPVDPAH